jgi:hypothetical protein
MNPSKAFTLSLLSAGLSLSLSPARADDASTPPAPPAANAAPDTPPADGQTPPPAHHRHMHPAFVLGELTAKLSLTPDQQKSVGSVIAATDTQLKAVREDDSLAREDKRAKMRTIVETTRGQIRALLTSDQQKIFDTLPTRGEHGDKGAVPTPAPTT